MLLKQLNVLESQVEAYRLRVLLLSPILLFEKIFGYNLVYFRGKVYSVPLENERFSSDKISQYDSSDYVTDIYFHIIEKLRDIADQNCPLFIDHAFGCEIYLFQKSFVALPKGIYRSGANEFPGISRQRRADTLADIYLLLQQLRNERLKVYLHVGLPKTASKFLQVNVFPHLAHAHYIDCQTNFFTREFLKFKYGNPLAAINQVRDAFYDYISLVDEDNVIISDESLTDLWDRGKGFLEKAIGLKQIFPAARILLVIREQTSLLRSLYLQHLKEGGCLSPTRFLRMEVDRVPFDYIDYSAFPEIMVETLDYNKLLTMYEDIFGAENVGVFVFEEMLVDAPQYVNKIGSFMHLALGDELRASVENRAYGVIGMWVARVLNKLVIRGNGTFGVLVERPFHSALNRWVEAFDRLLPVVEAPQWKISLNLAIRMMILKMRDVIKRITVNNFAEFLDNLVYIKADPISPQIKNQLCDFFRESNKHLSVQRGLELQRYDYF